MKYLNMGLSGMKASAISLGCMRLTAITQSETDGLVTAALESGVNYFDHADIYGGGECEKIFGRSLKSLKIGRDKLFIQSKCGIRKGYYDFSRAHIVAAAEQSLKSLGVDYLDALLLHRPDVLTEPEEVAAAFDELEKRGLVRYFGVSNHNPMRVDLLKTKVKQPLIANQLQFGIGHAGLAFAPVYMNTPFDSAVDRDGGALDYCRINNMTVQAWSPVLYGFFKGNIFDGQIPELGKKLEEFAEKYGLTPAGIATAWILRHPAGIQVIAGTTKPERLREMCAASETVLERKDWYEIAAAAGNKTI